MATIGTRAKELRIHREISSRERNAEDFSIHLDTEDIQSIFDCCISNHAKKYKIIINQLKPPQAPRTYHKIYPNFFELNSPTLAKPSRLRAESSDQQL
jgi:hypothetical protein